VISKIKIFFSGVIEKSGIKKIRTLYFLCFLHSLFLLFLGYFWLGTSYTFKDEALLIRLTTWLKKEFIGSDSRPSPDKVLFINTSSSKIPIETHEDELSLNPSVELITDRKALSDLLDFMLPFKEKIDLIVVDILFDIPAEGDTILDKRLREFKDKILLVSYITDSNLVKPPLYQVPYALSTYLSTAEMYFKYPVEFRGNKTVPTVMYEKMTGSEIKKKGAFFRDGEKFSLKSPITDFKVFMEDLTPGNDLNQVRFTVHNMKTLNKLGHMMDKEDLGRIFSGKLILIGDFSSDIHQTVWGPMAGVLILYNAYLTLHNGDHIMNPLWILLMLAGFTLISLRILTGEGMYLLEKWKSKYSHEWIRVLIDSVDDILLLLILTFLSYFFFNIHISILVLFVYLKLIQFILYFVRNKKNPAS
jgi:hypothetical protein